MAENTQRSRGRPGNYKFDRGGTPAEMGPYVGIVVNNVDAVRAGRLQVYIEEFGATNADGSPNLTDTTLWRTVSYCPPFYGATPLAGTSAGVGTYPGNRNSYGMWFTPPDLGVRVVCFFIGGDPSQGIYVGCLPEAGINHMIPAIGSSNKYVAGNKTQQNYFVDSPLLPVTEINQQNSAINENPKFYDQPKPVQSVVAGILFQQGLNKDPVRGPIRSNSQRESPSTVYGISTPGKAIYQGGLDPKTIRSKLEKGEVKPQDIQVIGRMGGHTFVMDDGDLEGTDTLIRIRTAKGHQITMSDDGDCFYITHANGQTWMEFGKQGTVDVYSTNSINLRTEGTLNLHADKNINMYAGGTIKMKAKEKMFVESGKTMILSSQDKLLVSGTKYVGVKSDGTLGIKSKVGGWEATAALNFKGKVINLNGAPTPPVPDVPALPDYKLADTKFEKSQGWIVDPGALETIVTRAPTHEPYPYHGKGVNNKADLNATSASQNPVANATSAGATTATSVVQSATSTVSSLLPNQTDLQTKVANKVLEASKAPLTKAIGVENFVSEIPASLNIGEEAKQIYDISQRLSSTSTGSDSTTSTGTIDLAGQQAAVRAVEQKRQIYEVAKAEYGITSPQAQEAFAEYKAALANLDKF